MENETSMLSVVIPVFNREVELSACLDSIMAQSVRPDEVIVVDDGSTDGSATVARRHPLGVRLLSAAHAGAAAARNIGLSVASGVWTMFFDSDDTMAPDHIERALSASPASADVVGWDVEYFRLDGSSVVRPFEPDDIEWHTLMHGTMSTARYMARTDLFRRVGGWNPEIRIWDDIDLGLRLLALAPHVVKVAGPPTVRVAVGNVSITGASWLSRLERYEAPLAAMARTLGDAHADWIALKRAILAADIAREDAAAGAALYRSVAPRPLAVRFAYRYRRMGGRGAARLLRPFFTKIRRP